MPFRMSSFQNKSVNPSPTVLTLSHTDYGRHFHLGHGVNIPSSPSQRLQSFVESEGSPYRFVVVGQLKSFKVIDDSFGHYMSVNVGQLQSTSTFTDMFNGQLDTLQHIEEVDRTNEPIHAQHAEWRTLNDQLVFRTYNVANYPLSSAEIGSFILAIVELRSLDTSCSPSMFMRTYWIEALGLHSLSSHEPSDEEFVESVIECWGSLSLTGLR